MVQPEMFQSLQHILARRPPRSSSMGPRVGPVGVTPLAEQAGRLEPQRAFSTCRRSRRAFALGAPSVAALQLREHRGLLAFHDPHQPPSCRACEHTCGVSAPRVVARAVDVCRGAPEVVVPCEPSCESSCESASFWKPSDFGRAGPCLGSGEGGGRVPRRRVSGMALVSPPQGIKGNAKTPTGKH